MPDAWDLRGKTVFITGAARGIGAEVARRVAGAGARVALIDLEPEKLEALAEELGPDAVAFEADVTDWEALERAVAGTVDRFGGIDVVFANAGIAPVGTIATISREDFERTVEVNLLGVWRTVRTCLPHVVERRGYVLIVASLAAALHSPFQGHYAATKAGVEAFANVLRSEIASTGTDVGVCYFSFIDTDMVREAFANPAADKLREQYPAPIRSVAPLERVGKAVLRGIERRARQVTVPRWVAAILLLRGLAQPLGEREARKPDAQAAIAMAEEEARRGRLQGAAPPA